MNDRDHDFAMAEYALHYAVQNIDDLSKERDGYKLNKQEIISDALTLLEIIIRKYERTSQ